MLAASLCICREQLASRKEADGTKLRAPYTLAASLDRSPGSSLSGALYRSGSRPTDFPGSTVFLVEREPTNKHTYNNSAQLTGVIGAIIISKASATEHQWHASRIIAELTRSELPRVHAHPGRFLGTPPSDSAWLALDIGHVTWRGIRCKVPRPHSLGSEVALVLHGIFSIGFRCWRSDRVS